MPADFHHKTYILPKFTRGQYRALMTTLKNALGFDTSDKAQFRFHVLKLLYVSGWKAVKLAFPHVSHTTVYRWKLGYEQSGKRLSSLLPKSTRPYHTRQMQVPWQAVEYIRSLREKYPRLGKEKIKLFLDIYCQREGIKTIGPTTIGKVVRRKNFFFQSPMVGTGKKRKTISRKRITKSPNGVSLGYLQVDGIKIWYMDQYWYLLTAVEVVSRQAFVAVVPGFASKWAKLFLQRIISQAEYPIHTIQTDNGSEFLKLFDQAIREMGLIHLFSYPNCPRIQGYVERFNRTIQEEFLVYNLDAFLTGEMEQLLTDWLVYYNQVRPHFGLNLLTPYQYLSKRGVCPKSM
jgi:hypothetical protein